MDAVCACCGTDFVPPLVLIGAVEYCVDCWLDEAENRRLEALETVDE